MDDLSTLSDGELLNLIGEGDKARMEIALLQAVLQIRLGRTLSPLLDKKLYDGNSSADNCGDAKNEIKPKDFPGEVVG